MEDGLRIDSGQNKEKVARVGWPENCKWTEPDGDGLARNGTRSDIG